MSPAPPTVPKRGRPQPFSTTGRSRCKACGVVSRFSAPLIAHVEADYPDDATKNRLCLPLPLPLPLPHPDTDLDWLRLAQADYRNQLRFLDDPELTEWLASVRLDLFGHLMGRLLAPPSAKPKVRDRILGMAKKALSATAAKLDALMAAEAALSPGRRPV